MQTTFDAPIMLGQYVSIKAQYASAKFKGVYEVVAVPGGNRKRYKIRNITTGQDVTADAIHFTRYDGAIEDAEPAMPTPGTVVTYKGAHYVITGASKYGAKISLLGGNGRNYTNVPVKSLKVLDPADFSLTEK